MLSQDLTRIDRAEREAKETIIISVLRKLSTDCVGKFDCLASNSYATNCNIVGVNLQFCQKRYQDSYRTHWGSEMSERPETVSEENFGYPDTSSDGKEELTSPLAPLPSP